MQRNARSKLGRIISLLDSARQILVFPYLNGTVWYCKDLTLNLLHNARVNPKPSAWAYLFGQFNYNATPLAPPGIKGIVHVKPHKRASWDPHGVLSYYTGLALNHYRCYTCYISKTKSKRVTDTISYLPSTIPIPDFTPRDHLQQALDDIVAILQWPHKILPFLTAGDDTTNAIRLVAEILNRSSAAPSQLDDTTRSTN